VALLRGDALLIVSTAGLIKAAPGLRVLALRLDYESEPALVSLVAQFKHLARLELWQQWNRWAPPGARLTRDESLFLLQAAMKNSSATHKGIVVIELKDDPAYAQWSPEHRTLRTVSFN
jgi:hypothetical protein